MTSVTGRLAAGRAAILMACAWCAQAAFAVGAPAMDTAPIAEKPAITGDPLAQLQQRYVSLFEKYRSAVVRVNVVPPSPSPDVPPQQVIVLTGFFISHSGDILTTHANDLQKNTLVYIDFDGVRYRADVVSTDLVTSLALLHLPVAPKKFTVLDLADNPDLPPISSLVMAITSKQGQTPGPSTGMVQGYNVNFGNLRLPTLYLRVNIPDEGAEGGAPVLDIQGRLVGIMLGGAPDSHWSFVLPTRAAQRVRDDLQTHGKVAYGQLGFDIEQKDDPENGVSVVIKSVDYDSQSPALAAGLKVGDVIKSIGNTTIHNDMDLRQVWFFSRPGQDLPIVIQRPTPQGDQSSNNTLKLTLHVGEMRLAPTTPAEETKPVANPPPESNTEVPPANLELNPDTVLGTPPPVISPGKAK